MARPKKIPTQTANITKEIEELKFKISERDKLISLLIQAHGRDSETATKHKQNIRALITFIESFGANWVSFHEAVIMPNIVTMEFDRTTGEHASNIRSAIDKLYGNNQYLGQQAPSVAQRLPRPGKSVRPN